jgi:adenylyltransferase/sulfurtransferase
MIPEVGVEGQTKLKNAKVLIIGAGGLGTPLGMYLAAAGVGKLGLIDFDTVSYSNLQRQVIYSTDDVGKPKVDIARRKLLQINPNVAIETYNVKLTSGNALEILEGYDIIADGSDNFATRYLVNDSCVLLGKPDVCGCIFRFTGQVTLFNAPSGPCYRCLYPEPPIPGEMPSCDESGVFGVLPGMVGSMQANEVIKYIIGKGELLLGRLLVLDALTMSFKELSFAKNPDCPVCGKKSVIKELIDYDEFCRVGLRKIESSLGVKDKGVAVQSEQEITVEQLKRKIDNNEKFFLLDIREPYESKISTIGGLLIPINDLPQRVDELNKDDEIIVYCRTGSRSYYAVQYLKDVAGFPDVKNLVGGINQWADKIDKTLIKY